MITLVSGLVGFALVRASRSPAPPAVASPPGSADADPGGAPTRTANGVPSPRASSPSPSPPLSLPGDFPRSGPGTFRFLPGEGPVLGRRGPVHRLRVGVEDGVHEDFGALARLVDRTLGDPRGWTAGGLRFQRVSRGAAHDFTIYLATQRTARVLCARGWVDIRINGEPYTSCRTPGRVVINYSRWRLSVPEYVHARVPLSAYREYVLNHEVGHELGNGHEGCPGAGRPAPVMLQQTLFLLGCRPNSWPYVDGRRHRGPPA